MNRITVDDSFRVRIDGLVEPVEIYDETGQRLGHFVPSVASDNCPYSAEELERMRNETGGRPLSEIWQTLGVK